MDTPVISGTAGGDARPAPRPGSDPADSAPEARAVRRFLVDPASSPLLVAAFAWDTAGPR